MRDRVPTKPNRYAVYDDSHNFIRYEYHERADEPTQAGDALNKANLLPDDVAAALGLTGNPQVKDAFNKILENWSFFPSLADCTWEEVGFYASRPGISRAWSIGDTKDVTLGTETITFQIVGFNHDDLASGGKAPVSFMMKNLLTTTQRMNATNTNVGSWNASEMRTTRISNYLTQFPADLRAIIKPVIKKTTAGNKQATIQNTTDSLWLPANVELNLYTTEAGYKDEGTAYRLFVDNASRVKQLSNGSGAARAYWTRSPHTGYATYFYSVAPDGSSNAANADNSYGVCLGFCV